MRRRRRWAERRKIYREQRHQPREGRNEKRERNTAQETSTIVRNGMRCPLGVHWPAVSRRTGRAVAVGLVDRAREKNKARAVAEIYLETGAMATLLTPYTFDTIKTKIENLRLN